jgi:hypothetical protein
MHFFAEKVTKCFEAIGDLTYYAIAFTSVPDPDLKEK